MTSPRAEQLVGTWQLQRWQCSYEDGTTTEPFGVGAEGLLLYSADGWMSACIMAPGRPPLSTPNPREAPEGERAAAFDGYFSYAGRWRIVDGRVQHEVTLALNPGMVGTLQLRDAELSGHGLTLSATEPVRGGTRLHRLEWRRPASGTGG
jgi:Lipocalin-like domain